MIEADKKEWSGILVYLECYKGELHTASEELIGEAVRLSEVSKDPVYVAGIGKDMDRIREALDGYPVAKAYLYESEDEYESPLYTKIMAECIEELKPAIVLVGGTYEGRSLAPGLAVRFQTGLTADCTGLAINEEGNLVQSRPAFGGNIMADIVTQFSRPQFATVRPGVMQKVAKNEQNVTEYVNKKVKKESKEIEIISLKAEKSEKGITEAKIVIVAGRGVKKKEDLEMLRTGRTCRRKARIQPCTCRKRLDVAERANRLIGEYRESGLYDYLWSIGNGTVHGRYEEYKKYHSDQ